MTERILDIGDFIDSRPLGRVQKTVFVLCFCLVFLDGFDAQAIGYVAPVLIRTWHIPAGRFGLVISVGLIGLMLGALFIAPLADRFGRRLILLISAVLFGMCSLLTITTFSVNSLSAVFFATGLGLGGSMPNAIALTSEYAPRRRHNFIVTAMFSGFTVGSVAAGLVSARIIAHYGWQSVFIVGGLLPLLAVPVMYFALPESPRFLLLRRHDDKSLAGLLRRIDPSMSAREDPLFKVSAEPAVRISVRTLLDGGWAKVTVLLWIIFFMSLLDIYLLVSWLPAVIAAAGAKVEVAIIVGTLLQCGGLVGSFVLGWWLDRTNPRFTMLPAYLLAAVCIAAIGVSAKTSIPLTMLVVFAAGFGIIGGQTAANAAAASSYPTGVRSTGVGWALGIGRIGSIVGPTFAGLLIARHISLPGLFLISSVPALCAALAATGLSQPAGAAAAELQQTN